MAWQKEHEQEDGENEEDAAEGAAEDEVVTK